MRKGTLYGLLFGLTVVGLMAVASSRSDLPEEARALPSPVLLRPFNHMVLDSSANVIVDSTFSMDVFYDRLAALKTASVNDGTNVVSIFHLGDSHIQAGFLTGTVMRNFHRDFGNAGRGLITPLRMAKTNEPSDYIIRSNKTWESSRVVSSRRPMPIGIGGVSILNREAKFSLTLGAAERDEVKQYAFNRVRVVQYPGAPDLLVDDPNLRATASYTVDENPYLSTIVLSESVSELTLSGEAPRDKRDSSIYYGFILENSRNGVLYHAAGINGAQFLHWSRPETLSEQMAALKPELVILSMGTNEALMGRSFSETRFRAQIDTVICRMKENNPQAVFLLTTPPDSYMRQRVNNRTVYKPNPLVEASSRVIREYAEENGYACWDLFAISGGEGSREMWLDNALFSRDHLHFTAEGYQVLGNYLYRAILKGYNQYVRDRYGESAPDPEI